MKTIKLGFLGMGTIATGVLQGLENNKALIQARKNKRFEIFAIAVKDINKTRDLKIDNSILTDDPYKVVNDPKIDIIVELMGGTIPAYEYVAKALKNKKNVVTANKALISEYGAELFTLAKENNVGIFFEASVAGGIPIIKALQSSLASNSIDYIQGILNGTCNYILSQMEQNITFSVALEDAQKKGYAESEPSLDIDGVDTAHKAAILASLAYGRWFSINEIEIQGIRDMKLADIKFAYDLGYKIKLIANIQKAKNETVSIIVKPTLIAKNSMLSSVNNIFNAVKVHGNMVKDTLFYGQGAGQDATSSAVCADILEAAEQLVNKNLNYSNFTTYNGCKGITDTKDLTSRFYIRLIVRNHLSNVISNITNELGRRNISIASIHQGESNEQFIPIVILTHNTSNLSMQEAILDLENEPFIKEKLIVYPVAQLNN